MWDIKKNGKSKSERRQDPQMVAIQLMGKSLDKENYVKTSGI